MITKLSFLFTLFLSFSAAAETTLNIFYEYPQQGTFIQHIKSVPVKGHSKLGNDGTNAFLEASKTPNSLFIINLETTILQSRFSKSPLDPTKTMDVVGIIGNGPFALGIRYDSPYNTLEQMVTDYKKTNRPILLAGSGRGINTCQFAGRWVESTYNIEVKYVFYQPGPQTTIDLENGTIDMNCRNGSDIEIAVRDKKAKLAAKFGQSEYGRLKGVPLGVSLKQSMVLYASKDVDKVALDKLLKEMRTKEYLDRVATLNETYVFFKSVDINEYPKEIVTTTKIIDDLINKNKFLSERLVK
jgi:hypothetical protein